MTRCLKNTVAIFQVLDKEMEWRRNNGLEEGFPALKTYKPIIAAGPAHPLEDEELVADYFRESPFRYTLKQTTH